MSRKFNDALDHCLELMASGENIASCVERYPQYHDRLIHLLEAASPTMKVASSATYRVEARKRGMSQVMQALSEGRIGNRRRFFTPLLRPVASPILVGFVVVFLAIVAAGGTTAVAADSVPGDPLYWVKTTKESVELKMQRSDMDRAEAHVRLAGARGYEIRRLVAQRRYGEAELLIVRLRRHLSASAAYAGVNILDAPVEMPRRSMRRSNRDGSNYISLHDALERESTLLRSDLVIQMRQASPVHRVRVLKIMRQSDLGYWIVVGAFEFRNAPPSGVFWMTEPHRQR